MSNENEPTIPPADGTGAGAESVNETKPAVPAVIEEKEAKSTESLEFPDDFEKLETAAKDSSDGDEHKTEPTTSGEEETHEGMGFLDHLEELRWRILRGGIAFLVAAIACAFFADFLVNDVLIRPLIQSGTNIHLQNLVPYGQLSLYFQVVFFSAFMLAFPYLAWEIWKFVEPGLHETERSASRFMILFISICFFTGIAFGYFVFLPISLKFFAGFGTSLITNNISVQDYISFFLGTLLTTGIVFELPFISYVLSKIGLLTPAFMRFYRRHAVVTMLVVAAIVTPSTDMVTQMVIAIPMILLYEISIFISGSVQKNRNKKLMEESAA
ncbi:MAG: twin-arginine translocase subunit TatC [Chlorobaculum sp.]|nr:twin-arginine translocase subunit TatC [Chlorobaculum sp.]